MVILALLATSFPKGNLQELGEVMKALQSLQAEGAPNTRAPSPEAMGVLTRWLARTWPVLLFCMFLLIFAGNWIYCAQVSYLTEVIRGEGARVSAFWIGGTRSFVSILLAGLLALGIYGGGGGTVWIGIALSVGLLSQVSKVLSAILVALLLLGAVVLFVWFGVRLSFWYLSIPADQLGPVAGLRISYQRTKGRWWYTAGFFLVLTLVAFAVGLGFWILEWGVGKVPGGFSAVLVPLTVLLGVVTNLYMSFFQLASTIAFYDGMKPQDEISGSIGVGGPVAPA